MATDPPSLDERFRRAVALIDAGDVDALDRLLAADPALAVERLDAPGTWLTDKVGSAVESFFARPYLLWFVAEDPIRNGTLPANIAQIAETIIRAARRRDDAQLREQLDYALRLVAWSPVASRCGVAGELVDVLVDAGARPADGITDDALVNGNFATAAHLVRRGARLTLATALCLERWSDADQIARDATAHDRQVALTLAAVNGNADALRRLLALGVDVNAFCTDVYTHSTPLHQAVACGSPESVRVLVEAGATLDVCDRVWSGTPLGWADYCGRQAPAEKKAAFREIEAYLREQAAAGTVSTASTEINESTG